MESLDNSSGTAVATGLSRDAGNGERTSVGVLPCLVLAQSEQRRRLIRAAAEAQAWDAILCCDIGEFLRCVFRRRVPLIIVDLPPGNEGLTSELREATETAVHSQDALLLVCGQGANVEHEIWSRSQGAWSYLSEAKLQLGFEFVLQQAREAIQRQERQRQRTHGHGQQRHGRDPTQEDLSSTKGLN